MLSELHSALRSFFYPALHFRRFCRASLAPRSSKRIKAMFPGAAFNIPNKNDGFTCKNGGFSSKNCCLYWLEEGKKKCGCSKRFQRVGSSDLYTAVPLLSKRFSVLVTFESLSSRSFSIFRGDGRWLMGQNPGAIGTLSYS